MTGQRFLGEMKGENSEAENSMAPEGSCFDSFDPLYWIWTFEGGTAGSAEEGSGDLPAVYRDRIGDEEAKV